MDRLTDIGLWLGRRAENVCAVLLASMFVTFLLQVLFRYFLNLPVGWTVEWVTIAWLWGILFGYAFVVREVDVIRLDLVYGIVPPWLRRGFDLVSGLTVALVFAWTLPQAWDYVAFMSIERTAYIRLPFSIVFAIYIPFAVAVILRSLATAWAALRGAPSKVFGDHSGHAYD
ncbi:TRAP transporter small permease [Marinibaculum pumilum]|uniref:TRAP transporter small permease protein n=1 Tax=Marinibaculum pumilum TaxID=1766165 RepID=A0ABV7KZ80_9PROT